ncbi:hypothetical protein KUV57_12405 [Epibacterium sp. DP7N7-1]|nr:hypothetical protein [Epibacterium sp. DP7N7-1]
MIMRFRLCPEDQYERLLDAWWTRVDSPSLSQENIYLRFFGTLIGYRQPDMLSEEQNPPDMCWRLTLF